MGRKHKAPTVKYVIISHNRITNEIMIFKTVKGVAAHAGIPYRTMLYWLSNDRKYFGRNHDIWWVPITN